MFFAIRKPFRAESGKPATGLPDRPFRHPRIRRTDLPEEFATSRARTRSGGAEPDEALTMIKPFDRESAEFVSSPADSETESGHTVVEACQKDSRKKSLPSLRH